MIVDGLDLFGDGVNIAARLEGVAPPGGIVVSRSVFEATNGKLPAAFEPLGELALKHMERPVSAFAVSWNDGDWSTNTAATSHPPDAPLPLPDKPSIAVPPFQDMSTDQGQEHFGDGMVEEIITELSRSRDFFVIARNSSFSYKGQSPDIRQVGRDLGVRYVLEGSVRKAANRLRITAQLFDAETAKHLWAERYQCKDSDIFSVQDEITEAVVASLEPQILLAESGLVKLKRPIDLNAWGHVTGAYAHIVSATKQDLQSAIKLLETATALDAEYARAQAYMAIAESLMAYQGWSSNRAASFDKAAEAARRAGQLDSGDPWSHFTRGNRCSTGKAVSRSLAALTRAAELHPNFALAHSRLGVTLTYVGRAEEGIEHTGRALRISPRDPLKAALLNSHAIALFGASRYDELILAAERASQARYGYAQALRFLVASRALTGDLKGARGALEDLQSAQPGITLSWVDENVNAPSLLRTHLVEGLQVAGLPE